MFSFEVFFYSRPRRIETFFPGFPIIELASSIHRILFSMVKLCDVRVLPHYP